MAELATAAPATELVAYQEGSIVSRKLLSTGGGNITIFAFDAGQELSEHSTPHYAAAHVIDGEAVIRIEQTSHRVPAGAFLLLPAGKPHAVRAEQRFKMVLTMLRHSS